MQVASKVSIVIPVYNNSADIEELSFRLNDALTKQFKEYEVIFINDGSRIDFKADANNISLEAPVFNTPANTLLKKLMVNVLLNL